MSTSIFESRARGFFRQSKELANRFAHINWALADQAIVSGTNFATTVLVARFLGIEELGRFALAWLAVFFAQNLQIALVITPMMTIGAKQAPAERPAYSGAILIQQFVLAVITASAAYVFLKGSNLIFPEWQLAPLALPVALLVLFGQGVEFLRRYYFTFSRPHLSFLVDCIRYVGQLVMLVTLFVFAGDLATTANAFYLMATTGFIGLLIGAINFRGMVFERETVKRITLRHWCFARWLAPSVISLWARENFIYTVVGASMGLAEVGILRAAQQLVTMVNVPLHGFANVVPMRAGAAYSTAGYPGLVDFIGSFVLRYKAGILVLLVVTAIAGEPLLSLVYGPEYAGNGFIVVAFALVMMIYLVKNTIAIMVHAMEATAYEFYASAASVTLMALTIYPLVQAFGVPGAMMSNALYECASLLAISFGLRKWGACK